MEVNAMHMSMPRTLALFALLFSSLTLAGPPQLAVPDARAADFAGGIRVRIGDLNLARPGQVAVLYRRIRVAAHTICDSPVMSLSHYQDCMARTVADAVARVNAPQLTALHLRHTQSPRGG
jgi:UrcA family protein